MSAPTGDAFNRVLQAIAVKTGARSHGDGRQRSARCPAHDDKQPSLSITRGTDRVLLKCHAGCDIDDILTALGLTRADLYDEPAAKTGDTKILATYDYHDEGGTLLFQVVRMVPKTFRQRRPDGTGDWIWNLQGTRRVLYRLPAVGQAAQAGQTVYVAEGEKDVHALEAAGVVATCNPGGAGKWRDEYNTALKGAHVVIVADDDEPGRKHAADVAAALADVAATVRVVRAAQGKDAADHLAAGLGPDQLIEVTADNQTPQLRRIELTPASAIRVRRVRWLWHNRLAYGTLALLAGREGLGKSTLAYHLAAQVSVGKLDGEEFGNPRSVLVCASEDSWEHTIVPRLIAAAADLDRVYRVEMITHDNMHLGISLPRDFTEVEHVATQTDAGLMLLDPLMSVIDAKLDTHRDREVRQALDPLASLADRTRMGILGLIHHNKSGSSDALHLVMGSKAFAAVARSVHTCIDDPDDETRTRRLFATSKNNLGRTDLPVLGFVISSAPVETDDEGTAWTGRLDWTGEVEGSIQEIMSRSTDPERGATAEAADWLTDYLQSVGGEAARTDVEKAARAAGHAVRTLARARERARIKVRFSGFPRVSYWSLPGAVSEEVVDPSEPRHEPPVQSGHSQANSGTTGTTGQNGQGVSDLFSQTISGANPWGDTPKGTTRHTSHKGPSHASRAKESSPHARGATVQTGHPEPQPDPCPDCGYGIDTKGHEINCEETP